MRGRHTEAWKSTEALGCNNRSPSESRKAKSNLNIIIQRESRNLLSAIRTRLIMEAPSTIQFHRHERRGVILGPNWQLSVDSVARWDGFCLVVAAGLKENLLKHYSFGSTASRVKQNKTLEDEIK